MTQAAFPIIAGKDRLTGGLAWLPLVGEERGAQRSELRRFLREHKSKYGLLVPSGDGQRYAMAGVAVAPKGVRYKQIAGVPAAAEWFANSASGPTLYVERLDNGLYWTLVSTGSGLDPRTDRVLRSAALVALASELDHETTPGRSLTIHCWPNIDAMPSELAQMARLTPTPLANLLAPDKRPRTKVIKEIGPPAWVVPAVLVVSTLAVAGYLGHGTYLSLQERREANRLAAERAAAEAAALLENQRADQADRDRRRASIHDALASPSPHALVEACMAVLQDLPANMGGWRLTKVSCKPSVETQVTYQRDSNRGGVATQSSFGTAAARAGLAYDIAWFGNEATVQGGSLELASRDGSVETLPTVRAAGELMASHSVRVQSVTKGGQFQVGPAQVPILESDEGDPGFRVHTVQMSGTGLWLLKPVIPELQHLKLESLDLQRDRSSWRWNAVGVLYTSLEHS